MPKTSIKRTQRRARHLQDNYYIGPADDDNVVEIWGYTDRLSYQPGDLIELSVSTTADTWDLEIARDGQEYQIVHQSKKHRGVHHPTPADCSIHGCAWPSSFQIRVEDDWLSGAYLFTLTGYRNDESVEEHHLVIIKSKNRSNSMLLLCATPTWVAYNCWGGSNAYEGICGENADEFSPILSLQRPWTRGFCKLPKGVPRTLPQEKPKVEEVIRYPYMEWAYANGYSKKYASAGWASYERHFALWAENQGYQLDYATLHDLHDDADLLNNYDCVVCVGHDEYWSATMRDHIDQWIESGWACCAFCR